MRSVILGFTVSIIAAAQGAHAACSDEAKAPLSISAWSVAPINDATTQFTLQLTSRFSKPTRMISGYIAFKDALGEDMGAIAIPRDGSIPAASAFSLELPIGSLVVPRITKISKDDVVARICVDAVIYEDGTKQEFE